MAIERSGGREGWGRAGRIAAVLLVALALVTALFVQVRRREKARVHAHLARRGDLIARELETQLSGALQSVESIAALMAARPDTGRRGFGTFGRRQGMSTMGILSSAWCVRVGADDRWALEEAARREGLTWFRVVERAPWGGMVPAEGRSEHVVAYFVEPQEGNEDALGFDLTSEPVRLEALRRAEETARTVITAPLRLVVDRDEHVGVLVVSPVDPGDGARGEEARVRGFGVGALRVGDVVTAALQGVHREGIALTIEDVTAPAGARLLYADLRNAPATWETALDVGGRRWRLALTPTTPGLDPGALRAPWRVLAWGLSGVGILGILLLVFLGRTTRLELLAAERARLVEELRRAVTQRDEFLVIAAHELRTPLTSLLLQLQLAGHLLRKGAPADPAPSVDRALHQAGRLARLVDGLLSASRITAGRFTLTREEHDLAEIVRETVARHEEEARKAGCEIDLSADVPVRGLWDRAGLQQVATNLVTNALKFGAGKPVEIAVSADEATATLTVHDRGIGLSADAIERIFGTGDRGVTVRSHGGLGLGLFIAREIVEAHGGSLRAESAPGQGATLVVTLPRWDRRGTETEAPPPRRARGSQRRGAP